MARRLPRGTSHAVFVELTVGLGDVGDQRLPGRTDVAVTDGN
jgi:hypothetical protein